MWKIVQIFDGDYGCEELPAGAVPTVAVTLENERGERTYKTVPDAFLTANGLDVGSVWPQGGGKFSAADRTEG